MTRVGYTGGDVPHATYRNHGGHAEAIEVIFDPSSVTYRDLLEFFFQIHAPTTLNRQGHTTSAQATARPFSTLAKSKSVLLKIRLQTLMRRVPARKGRHRGRARPRVLGS